MASLQAGCLPLGVETGHYRIPKVPLERRVCLVCNTDLIEDEFHFVMVCNKLNEERNKLLYHITQTDPSFIQLHPRKCTVSNKIWHGSIMQLYKL